MNAAKIYAEINAPYPKLAEGQEKILSALQSLPRFRLNEAGLFTGRWFPNAYIAAVTYQREASLRFADSCNERFSLAHRASFQKDAANLYAAARAALAVMR